MGKRMGMQNLYLAFQTAHDLMFSEQGLGLELGGKKLAL